MPVSAYGKFNNTLYHLGRGVPNMTSGATCAFKVALTNVAPNASAHSVKGDLADLSTSGGYTAGGASCTFTSWTQSGGVSKLILSDPPVWTGSGGGFTFRYAYLYDDFGATKPLIAYWDYGSSQLVAAGETFTFDLDQDNGVFTIGP